MIPLHRRNIRTKVTFIHLKVFAIRYFNAKIMIQFKMFKFKINIKIWFVKIEINQIIKALILKLNSKIEGIKPKISKLRKL